MLSASFRKTNPLAWRQSFVDSVRFTGATFQRLNGPVDIEARAIGRPELILKPEDRGHDPGVKLTRVVSGELLLRVSAREEPSRARSASLV